MCMVLEPEGPVVDLVNRNGSWLVSGAGVVPEDVVSESLVVDGMGEVMGMLSVLVDKDGTKDVLEVWVDRKGVLVGMVDIVVSSVLDPRRWGISPVGPVGGVVWPGARDEGLAVGGVTDERR